MEPEEHKLEQGRRRFRHFFKRSKKAQGKEKPRQSDQFKSSQQSEKPEIQEASEVPYEPDLFHSFRCIKKPSGMLLELEELKISLEEAAVHCEATANALHDDELGALF